MIKNVIRPLAESVLIPLGLTTSTSAVDAGIHKKILASGRHHSSSSTPHNTTLSISNDKIKYFIEIVKPLKDSGFLLKGSSETIKIKLKNKN